MKSIARLKEQARLHEQREEWDKAIQAYEQALELSEQGPGGPDLQLFNRIGDLHLRCGRHMDAVRSYEEAADRYAEAGFYNNAIALCNKALRYAPDRAELYRKLGRYSGAQGFLTDARRYFLEYAERKQKAGAWSEALGALNELADLADDAELREMLAQRLEAHGEVAMAAQQLRRAYELRLAAGETKEAEAVAKRLRQLDPTAELPSASSASGAPAAGGAQRGGGLAIEGMLPELDLEVPVKPAGREGRSAGAQPSSAMPLDYEGALELPMLDEPDDARGQGTPALAGLQTSPVDALPGLELAGPATVGTSPGLDIGDIDDVGGIDAVPGLDVNGPDADESLPDLDFGEPETDAALDGGDVDSFGALHTLPEVDESEVEPEPLEALSGFEDGEDGEDGEVDAALPGLEVVSEVEEPSVPIDELTLEPDPVDVLDLGSVAEIDEPLPGLETEDSLDPAAALAPDEALDSLTTLGAGEAGDPLGTLAAEDFSDLSATVGAAGSIHAPAAGGAEEASDLLVLPVEAIVDPVEAELSAALDRAQMAARTGAAAQALKEIDAIRGKLADPGMFSRALDVVERVVERTVDTLAAHQLRVELAMRAGDRARLIQALHGLAGCLDRKGSRAKAEAVYERILELDPTDARARAELRRDTGGDDYVDLGSFITDEMLDGRGGPGGQQSDDADFAELLSRFKAKTAVPTEETDPSSHYDLGLAFKEMGLIEEAIVEFQRALDGGAEQLKIYEELGQCFMQKGEYALAAKILERALKVPHSDDRELLGVYYHLGCCHEALGARAEARAAFERVVELGGIFRDVAERLARL